MSDATARSYRVWDAPTRWFHWINERFTRWGARNLSPQFLAEQYDRATVRALRALDSVADADFSRALVYPDWDPMLSGVVTLEALFQYVKRHFDAHAAEIEKLINGWALPD